MDRSRFIAGLIGPVLTAVAVSIFINGEMIARMAADPGLIFFAGIVTLPAGLAIVMAHNVWKGWPAIVTVFGWLAVVGGAARILIPAQLAGIGPAMVAQGWPVMVMSGLVLVFGLILSLKAFRA